MGFLTGRSKQSSQSTSRSENRAYPFIQDTFGGTASSIGNVNNMIASLLGIGGQDGQREAFNTFRDSTGYQNVVDEMRRGTTSSAAARGLFGSGATARALERERGQVADSYFGNYMDRLFGLGTQATQAGSLITGAGQVSEGQSTQGSSSKPGLGGIIGAGLSGVAASDRALKTNIEPLGELEPGLMLYSFDYINGDGPFVGVMADEVESLYPEAMGPSVNGFATVDYDTLKERITH